MHTIAFMSVTVVVLALGSIAAASRGRAWRRWLAIALTALVVIGTYPTFLETLSRPKPANEEWYYAHAEQATVAGIYIDEGTALYLYLLIPGVNEPRSYVFPWSDAVRKLAADVAEALRDPANGGVSVLLPFEKSLETEREVTVSPLPQLKGPNKPPQPKPPVEYRRPDVQA